MKIDYEYVLGKEEELKREDYKRMIELREELKNYNLVDFIKKVSALMLFPQNQSKSVIFQGMISTALSIPKEEMNENNNMSAGKFNKIVKRFSSLYRIVNVDPPEFPFVLPVIFYENYHIFMGANSLDASALSSMLRVLMLSRIEIGEELYSRIIKRVIGFLKISEDIFKKTEIKINELKSYNKDEDILVPNSDILNKYVEYIEFQKDYLDFIFGDSINSFICNFGEINVKDIDDFDEQLFYDKPIIRTKNTYVIIDVTTFLNLLMKEIILFVNENCKLDIVDKYNKCIKDVIEESFFKLGNVRLAPSQFNLELIDNNYYCENLYLSGNDGVIINLILFDNGNKYKTQKNYRIPLGLNFIDKRIQKIQEKLLKNGIDKYKITTIVTPTSIGRNMYFPLQNNKEDILLLSYYEIQAISINEKEDSMFFQRYLTARKRLKYYEKNLFSEWNIIVFYINNSYSFYVDDKIDTKEAIIALIGEYSSDYILKAYQSENKHLCRGIENNSLLEVIRLENNTYCALRIIRFKNCESSI